MASTSTCSDLVLFAHVVLVACVLVSTDALTVDAAPPVTVEGNRGSELSKVSKTYPQDLAFLRDHVETLVLGDTEKGPSIAVVPAYQGRVMTSTASGGSGASFGWINYDHIAAGKTTPKINVYGGEERFWLGPEGGQFSVFFERGDAFEFSSWQTPALIDTDTFPVVQQSEKAIDFRKAGVLRNYADFEFEFLVERRVELLDADDASSALGVDTDGARFVGYRTTNRLTNTGKQPWQRQTGLLSIWMLGMYKPSASTTVVIPIVAGPEEKLGPAVNDAYFGKPPAERLRVDSDKVFFSGDGKLRSKLGVSPQRSRGVCGSYAADNKVLTIVRYEEPASSADGYVNSMWELQDEPFSGDAINTYNDGPPAPGEAPLGPFYELETSSPALSLAPGDSGVHVQDTYHFVGDELELDPIAVATLGVSLREIREALPTQD